MLNVSKAWRETTFENQLLEFDLKLDKIQENSQIKKKKNVENNELTAHYIDKTNKRQESKYSL